jgi:hypothetical protein
MRGRFFQIVGLVLLAVIVASVVSPPFDLAPTALRTHKRAMTHVALAIPLFLRSALPVSKTSLTVLCIEQSHQAYDIVTLDCARIC